MRGTKATPHLHDVAPLVRRPVGRIEAAFDAEGAGLAPGFIEPGVYSVHGFVPPADEWAQRQEAIGNLRRALDRGFSARADPDRDGLLNRARIDASRLDRVKPAVEGHHALGPQLAHQPNLFFEAAR